MTVSRTEPAYIADERTMLESWLEYHRATLAWKCDGLAVEQLRMRAVPPSTLSLLGIVRHMADVERNWFRRTLADENAPPLFYSDEDLNAEFDHVDDADPEEAFSSWRHECEVARDRVRAVESLDAHGARLRHGEAVSLRWILVHMIEEYARHNGHADLLRERIDGSVGD